MLITKPYLWLPIDNSMPMVTLHLFCEGKKIDEFNLRLAKDQGDFYAYKDMHEYLNKEVDLFQYDEKTCDQCFVYDKKPENPYPFTPKLHYEMSSGYMLDPNGLIYHKGTYHYYHQYNPYGTEWNNMHWGHAASKDLVHWHEEPIFMYPDEHGPRYSGCAIEDKQNLLGYGNDAILYYFTSPEGKNEWSRSAKFNTTQRLAVSTDGGKTCFIDDRFVLEELADLNRDPQVFYHKPSGSYIMALFLIDHDFMLLRSKDLLHFEPIQRMTFNGMWECPNLMEVHVEKSDETHYVLWSVEGYYVVGDFDGNQFTLLTGVQKGYAFKMLHAAQRIANIEDRCVMMSVIHNHIVRGHRVNMASLPVELTLTKDLKIKQKPAKEILNYFNEQRDVAEHSSINKFYLNHEASLFTFEFEGKGITRLNLLNMDIELDFNTHEVFVRDKGNILMHQSFNMNSLNLIVDERVIEFFMDDGCLYTVFNTDVNTLGSKILMESEYDALKVTQRVHKDVL